MTFDIFREKSRIFMNFHEILGIFAKFFGVQRGANFFFVKNQRKIVLQKFCKKNFDGNRWQWRSN